ncbi:MAG: electron transfer flavoprotein subunit beta/FixA family protein [Candidatus Electryonea clarkiae]|nr:electron transfer flavoprotein subunit beta/FixA family protein [Candidatus Electryonea clarkiae]MDP8288789.1 electron transfer flavoprotein subunit beta/FixA family protein [Candidatus Electryonea clarkiae]
MKIAVLVKLVPDSEAQIKLNADKSWIETRDISWVMGPYDEYAIEEALKTAGDKGGEVTVISYGDEQAVDGLRKALAMGVHNAVRVKREGEQDLLGTANALAEALKDNGYDLIFTGFKANDDDCAAIGTMVGTLLDIPVITEVSKLEVGEGNVRAERDIEGGREIIEASMPCVITAQKGLNEPRYASLKGIMMAKKKQIEEVVVTHTESRIEMAGLNYPPERAAGKVVGEGAEAVPELVRLLREEAKVIE